MHTDKTESKSGVTYLTFPLLTEAGVRNAFSTKLGGVSEGHLESMNLSFSRGEPFENVRENYMRIAEAIGCKHTDFVLSRQVHEDAVLPVTRADCGGGMDDGNVPLTADALITDEAGVVLVKHYADCTPVYIADPVRRSLCLVHAGWRGTVLNIAGKAVSALLEKGSRVGDLVCAIGPCICAECFEVDEPVAEHFRKLAGGVVKNGHPPKSHVDLKRTNYNQLTAAGVNPDKIAISSHCTACESELLYSHRRDKGMTGTLAAFMGWL